MFWLSDYIVPTYQQCTPVMNIKADCYTLTKAVHLGHLADLYSREQEKLPVERLLNVSAY
jgi:hypothetical protein